jgi:hypothetical protein
MILSTQETEALHELLESINEVQHTEFSNWEIQLEACPKICDTMQDVSYFLAKLKGELKNAIRC